MAPPEEPAPVAKADWYRFDDGTEEVVFAVEGESVLTVREYDDVAAFESAVASATYLGQHDDVGDLPDVEAFEADER
jgi:hypothetical protein